MTDLLVRDERDATGGHRVLDWSTLTRPEVVAPRPNVPFEMGLTLGAGTQADLAQAATAITRTFTPSFRADFWVEVAQALGELASAITVTIRAAMESHAELSVARRIDELRSSTGLGMQELAEALGLSRRTLYFWLERGAASPEGEQRLAGVRFALEPLTRSSWEPAQRRRWLVEGDPAPAALLAAGDYDSVREQAEAEIRRRSQVRQARRLEPESQLAAEVADVDELDEVARSVALAAFSRARQRTSTKSWVPPEVTGMGDYDDE